MVRPRRPYSFLSFLSFFCLFLFFLALLFLVAFRFHILFFALPFVVFLHFTNCRNLFTMQPSQWGEQEIEGRAAMLRALNLKRTRERKDVNTKKRKKKGIEQQFCVVPEIYSCCTSQYSWKHDSRTQGRGNRILSGQACRVLRYSQSLLCQLSTSP